MPSNIWLQRPGAAIDIGGITSRLTVANLPPSRGLVGRGHKIMDVISAISSATRMQPHRLSTLSHGGPGTDPCRTCPVCLLPGDVKPLPSTFAFNRTQSKSRHPNSHAFRTHQLFDNASARAAATRSMEQCRQLGMHGLRPQIMQQETAPDYRSGPATLFLICLGAMQYPASNTGRAKRSASYMPCLYPGNRAPLTTHARTWQTKHVVLA
ncbi:hypothetical protein X797_008823 [Metarhizium robertsii]|uniref:Uncharacterized protein n=1 Tax=Metarhizium robertsii TaxID=568076 RepID=A0A014MZY6_9HYPO|nr:hypothetical protein X797_008823 [Metarhizium robertsii]